jgi:pimeloyl-ACP methyl ester carboxylesterase
MHAKETVFELHGLNIAAKVWNEGSGVPTLALHGWLDNAASFDFLAPLLPNAHIVAIDFWGHGHSSHLPPSAIMHMADFVVYCTQLADLLGWDKFALLGHSLGGCVASLIAGAIPERILSCALIDALGPITTSAKDTPTRLHGYIDAVQANPNKTAPKYATQEDALDARLKATPMSKEGCLAIVKRGTKQLADGQWTWRTDPRLLLPSALHFTEDQALAFLQQITAPTAFIYPEPGLAFLKPMLNQRIQAVKHLKIHRIPGHHHVHLDSPQKVAECLQDFFIF